MKKRRPTAGEREARKELAQTRCVLFRMLTRRYGAINWLSAGNSKVIVVKSPNGVFVLDFIAGEYLEMAND